MNPPSRRQFIRNSLIISAAAGLNACGSSSSSNSGSDTPDAPDTGNPGDGTVTRQFPEPEGFDFPLVDTLPFAHGVASGDPLADRVIIWTRITEAEPGSPLPVTWEVASSPDFNNDLVASGSQTAGPEHDWTVKVDVTGLQAATTYYYRFTTFGVTSMVGRTRTAPADDVADIRLAVVSCSSYWSSYWDGYRHIANRNDLDLVVHCGDYIYDFVDQDEEVRARLDRRDITDVDDRDWLNLDECRRRYALYRSDPNLCRAHQQHPWAIVWDNHDLSPGFGNELSSDIDPATSTCTLADTARAFYEWTPTRPVKADGSGEFIFYENGEYPAPANPRYIYRKLPYGPMLDIFCIDTQYLNQDNSNADSSHLSSGETLLDRAQFEWLTQGMEASKDSGKTWRLLLNQTWIAPFSAMPIEQLRGLIPGNPLDDLGTRWLDYSEERAALFQFLRDKGIDNNIFVSGDMHGNWASDLIEDNSLFSGYLSSLPIPNTRSGSTSANQLAGFRRATTANLGSLNNRADSVGVEFAPSSMGRGAADEMIANPNPISTPVDQILFARIAEEAIMLAKKNVQFMEWVDHGYGIVHLQADRAYFEFWWQDKLTPGAEDVLGFKMVSFAEDNNAANPPQYRNQIDDVALHNLPYEASSSNRTAAEPAPEANLNPR